jgi:hypothetical protein
MKDLSQNPVVKELVTSLSLLKQNIWLVVTTILIDAAFLFFYGFLTPFVGNAITAHVVLISNKISQLMAQQKTGMLYLLFTPEVRPLTYKMLLLILIFFVLIYIIYTIFQGTTWWLSRNIAGEKDTYRSYFFKFAKINILWIVLYALYKCLDALAGVRYVIVQKFAPGTPNILGNTLDALFVILVISAIFSYPQLKKSALFRIPVKTSIPAIILSTAILIIARYTPILISYYAGKPLVSDIMTILSIILFFPAIILIRVYLTRVLKHVHTRD